MRFSSNPHARMYEMMVPYHNGFRSNWRQLHKSTEPGLVLSDAALEELLAISHALSSHLDMHHSIEEAYIFPVLGKKMKEFSVDHIQEHHDMLAVLHDLEQYTQDSSQRYKDYLKMKKRGVCNERPATVFDIAKMRTILDTLKPVLFEHMAHEESSLKPENMAKYWSVQEMASMPM